MALYRFKLNSGVHSDPKAKLVNPDGSRSDCPRTGFEPGDIIETERDLSELNGSPYRKRFELIKTEKTE